MAAVRSVTNHGGLGERAISPCRTDRGAGRNGPRTTVSSSWLPLAGEVTKNVFHVMACNGHGLAQSHCLGALLADRIAGGELHDDLGAVWRARSRFAPSLLKAPTLRAVWAVDRIADRLNSR